MGQPSKPIQIRTLPRPNENPSQPDKRAEKAANKARVHRLMRIYVGVGVTVALAFAILFWEPSEKAPQKKSSGEMALGDEDSPEALVNRYLQEGRMKRQMEMQNRDLENKVFSKPLGKDATVVKDSDRTLGVSLEQENAAEKVYNDLYGQEGKSKGPISPDDRINMRIEQEQWLSVAQKQERKAYIQSFLKEAYDAGYAIDLDENLVVIKVRKVTSRPSQTLDKVLENLARKGY